MQLGEEESDFERRKRLQAEVLASIKKFSAGDRLPREAVHEREAGRSVAGHPRAAAAIRRSAGSTSPAATGSAPECPKPK